MRRGQRNTSAWPRAPAEAGTFREAPGQRASVGLLPQDPCGGKMRLPSGKQKSPRVLVWENEGQDEEITVYSLQESRDDFQLIAPRLSQRQEEERVEIWSCRGEAGQGWGGRRQASGK